MSVGGLAGAEALALKLSSINLSTAGMGLGLQNSRGSIDIAVQGWATCWADRLGKGDRAGRETLEM